MHHWKLLVWNVAFWRRKKTFKFCCSNIWSTITYKHSWPINTNSICKTHQTLSCLLCESLAYNFTQIKGGSASIWILYSSMIYPPPVMMYVTKVTDAQLLYTEKAVSDSRFQHHLLQAVFLFTHLNHLQRHQGKRNSHMNSEAVTVFTAMWTLDNLRYTYFSFILKIRSFTQSQFL